MLKAKFDSRCAACDKRVQKGRAIHDDGTGKFIHLSCWKKIHQAEIIIPDELPGDTVIVKPAEVRSCEPQDTNVIGGVNVSCHLPDKLESEYLIDPLSIDLYYSHNDGCFYKHNSNLAEGFIKDLMTMHPDVHLKLDPKGQDLGRVLGLFGTDITRAALEMTSSGKLPKKTGMSGYWYQQQQEVV
jgi:hypothetical protein